MSVTLVGIAQSFFENLLILPNNDCSGGTAQYKVECLLESAEFESFTEGRRTSLKIAAVATAALEIFGASCLFGWFAHFDDFSVALNFLERTVPLNGYGIVFNALFINDCARTQFTYVLLWFCQKRERVSTISRSKQKSEFLRQLLKTRDSNELTSLSFTLVHRSEQCQV